MENNDLEEGKKPLTIQQRMKIGRRMKRLAPKLVRARKRAAKKMANTEKLMKRAQKAAIKLARKKVAGKKGLAYAKLSPGEKISVDKMVSKRYTSDRIKKIAKKLMPKVRKAEVQRLQLARGGGEQTEQVEKQPLTIQQLLWETGGAGEWGTTKLRNKYASETPGQMEEEGPAEKAAKDRIKRDKIADKNRRDDILDRARTRDTISKNQQRSANTRKVNRMTEDSDMKSYKELFSEKKYNKGLEKACWKGYKAVGMKDKNGKKVPNCVPEEKKDEDI